MITVAQYIVNFLSKQGLEHCFMVPGGGAMFLNEGFRKNSKINVTPMHHEQACSMAAEGYSKLNNKPAIVSVTSGPGAINALNGVHGAYTDSVPMFIVSGQVKRETYGPTHNKDIRQLGDQEVDIVSMVKKITKFSATILDLKDLDKLLHKAYESMITGRKGPVWLDVPIDIQSSNIEVKPFKKLDIKQFSIKKCSNSDLDNFFKLLDKSNRPVVVAGSGIRLSDSEKLLIKFLEKYDLPITTTFNSHDLVDYKNKHYVGRQGTIGDRSGNFVVQNSDLLIILGSRLNIRQTGYNFEAFAPNAKKIMVDVDIHELNKKSLNIDLKINSDLNYFLNKMLERNVRKQYDFDNYIAWGKNLQEKYPAIKKEYFSTKNINPYVLMELLHQNSLEDDVIVTSDGTAAVMSSQALKLKKNQRLFSNSGAASMGYGLPASIGACFAADNFQNVICIEGDGSIQMNIQELATVIFNKLNLKIIIIENGGYLSIKQTQQRYFKGNFIACGPESGLGIPNLADLSKAYGIPFSYTKTVKETNDSFKKNLTKKGPHVFVVSVDKNQQFEPKPSSKRLKDGSIVSLPLDDMAPFISRKELNNIRAIAADEGNTAN